MSFDIGKRIKSIITVTITAVFILLSVLFIFTFKDTDKIKTGVEIEGIHVSGKKINEAREMLIDVINKRYTNARGTMEYDNHALKYSLDDISYVFLIDNALTEAYHTGREGKLLSGVYDTIKLALTGKNITIATEFDINKLMKLLEKIKCEVDKNAKNAVITYNKGNIAVSGGTDGQYVDIDKNANLLENQLKRKIFGSFKIITQKIEPEISYDSVKEIDSVVSYFQTGFNTGDYNRGDNIRLACKRLNGKIIMPGAVFSMNAILGPRTLENGYKEAPVIFQNELVQGTGGGICQVTTTLYNAILKAGLKIIERSHHSMPLAYVNPGQDATIAEDSIDFKFQNDSNYPICLNTEVVGSTIKIRLLGRSDPEKKIVKLRSEIIETIPPRQEEYIIDDSLQDGESVVVRKSRDGLRAVLYRDIYSHNNVFEKSEIISEDYYKPVTGQVKVNSHYREYIKTEGYENE